MNLNNVTWPLGNSLLLDCVAPMDYGDPSTPVAVVASGGSVTVTGHILSARVKGVTLNASNAGSNSGILLDPREGANFTAGDRILIEHGVRTYGRYTLVGETNGNLTISPALTAFTKVGARIWKTFGGAALAGSLYGTPSNVTQNWGYVMEAPYDYDGDLRRAQSLEALAIVSQAGTGAHWQHVWKVSIAEEYGNP